MAASMIPSILKIWPTLFQENAPQNIMLPTPCSTVGTRIWYWESCLVIFGRWTYFLPSFPNNLIQVLPEYRTFFQSCIGQLGCFLANSNLAFSFFLLINDFLTPTCPNSPTCRSLREIVLWLTSAKFSPCNSQAINIAFFSHWWQPFF